MVKLSEYFNSNTNTGRANVAKATYASIALIYVYSRFRRKKTSPKQDPKEIPSKQLDIKELPPSSPSTSSTTCPKCQMKCDCQCQPVTEAAEGCGTCESQNIKTEEAHPASYFHVNQHYNSNSTNIKNKNTTSINNLHGQTYSKLINDAELQEVLKENSFGDWEDPW